MKRLFEIKDNYSLRYTIYAAYSTRLSGSLLLTIKELHTTVMDTLVIMSIDD